MGGVNLESAIIGKMVKPKGPHVYGLSVGVNLKKELKR